jgi:ubiquinone biosynthesis protein
MRFYLGYKNIKRLRQIVTVLIKHGFYPLLERLHLIRLISISERIRGKKAMREGEALPDALRLRFALEELGPSFIKLGQILSTRSDLLPEEYIRELLKLQDEVTPFDFKNVVEIVEKELNAPLGKLFQSVEERPVATASIAQVHRAVTTNGDEVAIKVQRPGIEEIINTDISVVTYIARLMERYMPESRLYNPVDMVAEFSCMIKKEMDFTLEGSYMERFSKEFSGDPRVLIPKVFWELSSKKVLTMERVSGIKIDNLEKLSEENIDTKDLAHLIADLFFKQVFEFGTFHGDLHPGNIFVLGPDRIAFVDFGIVGRIERDMMENLADIFIGIAKEDYELLTKVYMKMGMIPEDIDEVSFKREYHDLLLHYFGRPLKSVNFGELLVGYVRLAARYNIRLPRDLLLLNKCIIELEGLARLLHPDINILQESEPYAKRLVARRISPSSIAGEAMDTLMKYRELAESFPSQMNQILKKMISDKFTIDFVHKGLEDFMGEMDRSSNRLTVGVVIAALIIGTSLILAFGGGPLLFGLPIFGIIGFTIAGFLGLWLAYQILRSGKF